MNRTATVFYKSSGHIGVDNFFQLWEGIINKIITLLRTIFFIKIQGFVAPDSHHSPCHHLCYHCSLHIIICRQCMGLQHWSQNKQCQIQCHGLEPGFREQSMKLNFVYALQSLGPIPYLNQTRGTGTGFLPCHLDMSRHPIIEGHCDYFFLLVSLLLVDGVLGFLAILFFFGGRPIKM